MSTISTHFHDVQREVLEHILSFVKRSKLKYHLNSSILLAKIVVVGEGVVGKSCTCRRYVYGHWDIRQHQRTTIGADYLIAKKRFLDQDINLQIWDLMGNQRFGFERFWRETDGVLLLFNLTDRHSFYQLHHWVQECRERIPIDHPGDVPIVICGNKVDLVRNRTVTFEEAHQFCSERGIRYFEISAANQNSNIDAAFQELAEQILFARQDLQPIPLPTHLCAHEPPPQNTCIIF